MGGRILLLLIYVWQLFASKTKKTTWEGKEHVNLFVCFLCFFRHETLSYVNWWKWWKCLKHVGVSKNKGTPKWMVYDGKPYLKWMIWGENPLFSETPMWIGEHDGNVWRQLETCGNGSHWSQAGWTSVSGRSWGHRKPRRVGGRISLKFHENLRVP